MRYRLNDAETGPGTCRSVRPKGKWNAERRVFTSEQDVDRATGLPRWEGTFDVFGGSMQLTWASAEPGVVVGDSVGFVGLTAYEARNGRWYIEARGFSKAAK